RERVLREARAAVERALMATQQQTSLLRPLVEDLQARRERIKLGGGEEKIAKQHREEKLTARERLALLIDEGSFTELGIHGRPHSSQRAMEGREAPADGVITGYGKVEGRLVAACAYDFTVMAGSMGMTGELKVGRLRELALTKRIPFIWLLDSAGARIQEAVGSLFAGSGHLFREEVVMSGVIPQIAALMGPCAAGTAYIPGLADFVPMVKGRGSMALAGPYLTKAVTGEDVTQEELGGSKVHTRISGVGDLEVESDEECIAADKAARFINLCDAFGIPLLFLQDVPGFMVGTKVEQAGIIRHGAKMLYAVSRATVPKVTVVIRKAYGAGYYVMCGKAYEPDLIVAWPSAEISVMGPEGAVNIIFRKQIEASEDPDATRAQMIEGIRKSIDPYIAAGNAMIDDVIDPRETRPTVIRAFEMAATKRVERPWKKHGVMPV